jgi:hypothetical protein
LHSAGKAINDQRFPVAGFDQATMIPCGELKTTGPWRGFGRLNHHTQLAADH